MAAAGRIHRPNSDAGDPHPPSSRSSVVGAPPMPPIAEDEVAYRLSVTGRHPNIIWPRTPLRVPQKSPRRALASAEAAGVTAAATTTTTTTTPNPAPATTPTTGTPTAPPPYAPVTHLPPQYKEKLPSESSESDEAQKGNAVIQPRSSLSPSGAAEAAAPEGEKKLGWRDRQWFGSRRKRWGKFICLGLLVIAVIVGLAVGLSLGLKSRSRPSGDDKTDGLDHVFPAGSYSFETTLQRESTSCTSRPSTWRCYPYTTGSNATFFWVIDRNPGDSDSFIVSSGENPLAPSFANLTTSLLDVGHHDERLVFDFDMDKTVVPSDARAPQNRAAKCTFGGTKFKATLWTRRGGGGADDTDTGEKFGAWPGDVEIIQSKDYELGEPKCEDENGNEIADVQANAGFCTCDYASFQLG